MKTFQLFAVATLVLGVVATIKANACGTAFSPQEAFAKAMAEKTLIVWNPDRKIEHFIRSVTFDVATKSLGFIVPTPSKPKISESDESVFGKLQSYVECKLDQAYPFRSHGYEPSYWKWLINHSESSNTKGLQTLGGSSVRVLERSVIAGMDVAVLDASDPNALLNWLKANHFDPRPGLLDWSKKYIEDHWIFTAFKYMRPSGKGGASEKWMRDETADGHLPNLQSKTIRLSFKTDQPMYPYREPKDAELESRELSLFIAAPSPMTASLKDPSGNSDLHLERLRAVTGAKVQSILADVLRDEKFSQTMQLTEFHDGTLIRPDSDIVFQTTVDSENDFSQLGADLSPVFGPFINRDKYLTYSRVKSADPLLAEESATVQDGILYTNKRRAGKDIEWWELSFSKRDFHSINDMKYWVDFFVRNFDLINFDRRPEPEPSMLHYKLIEFKEKAADVDYRPYLSTCKVGGNDSLDLSSCRRGPGSYLFSVSRDGTFGKTIVTMKQERDTWISKQSCD